RCDSEEPVRRDEFGGGSMIANRSFGVLKLLGVLVVAGLPALPGPGLLAAGTEEKKPLTFCAVPAALPRTGKATDGTARGFDAGVARLLAQSLGRNIEFHWCAGPTCAWKCLREGRCDVVLGQPDGSGPARGVAWSVPYAGGQFGLVVPKSFSTV